MKTQQSLNLTFRCLAISNYHYAVHPMLTHLFLSLSRSNYKNTPRKERIFRMNLFGQWTLRSEHIRLNTAVHQPTRINKYLFLSWIWDVFCFLKLVFLSECPNLSLSTWNLLLHRKFTLCLQFSWDHTLKLTLEEKWYIPNEAMSFFSLCLFRLFFVIQYIYPCFYSQNIFHRTCKY